MATLADFRLERPTWCPGCGDFTVLAALMKAAVNLGLSPDAMIVTSGIGCSGKLAQHFGSYGFHTLHGRAIPTAVGAKLANRELTVVAAGGDGDGYGIGLSHFIHAVRRNIDITYIVMDNHIYGLTTGQASPTSDRGMQTKTSPYGTAEWPIKPLELALAQGATFVAQGFSGDARQLVTLIEKGMQHRGFALINIFSPCVTFNKINTYDWYKSELSDVDADPNYDRSDRLAALHLVAGSGSLVAGVLYAEQRPTFEDDLYGLPERSIARQDLTLPRAAFAELLETFR